MTNQAPTAVFTPDYQFTAKDKKDLRWQLLAFVIISALTVLTGISFDSEIEKYIPEAQPLASTFNKRPSGLSGLFEIAKNVGLNCNSWSLPYRELPATTGMLVIVAPKDSLQDFETEQILDWVSRGNDLVYLDRFDYKMFRRLLEKIDIKVADGEELNDFSIAVPKAKSSRPEFAHVKNLRVTTESRLKGGLPLLTDKSGTLVAELNHGKGRIYLGTTPNLCVNRRLSDKEDWPNFQFLVNVFRTAHGDILFDEHCHGYTQGNSVFSYLAQRTPGLIFRQLLLILAFLIWNGTRRFGRIKSATILRKISNLEYINGLANTYRRAKANTGVLTIISQSFRSRLGKTVGVSTHDSDDKLIEHLRQYAAFDPNIEKHAARIESLLKKIKTLVDGNSVSDAQLQEVVEECDRITTSIFEISKAKLALPSRKENG